MTCDELWNKEVKLLHCGNDKIFIIDKWLKFSTYRL